MRAISEQPTVLEQAHTAQHQNRLQVCMFLKGRINRGGKKLLPDTVPQAAMKFNLLIYGVKKIWRAHKASMINPTKFKIDVARKKGSGRKRNVSDAVLIAQVKDVEFCF